VVQAGDNGKEIMKKKLFSILWMLFPLSVFADGSMTLAPPITDYSVGFLANIFGVVDGVLHGTGSQIMGSIFEVFNAAVMAIGGIIVTYTMILSTMNTAHEGEMLGKKWNSIWVPVRATAGFALLIPKASGFCLLQVFVMWVVVQGVGAADKVWNAALSYLNRGGVIIQEQVDPTSALLGSSGSQKVTMGAMVILSGQVCMLAVQQILQNTLQSYTATTSNDCSICKGPGGLPSPGVPVPGSIIQVTPSNPFAVVDLCNFCQSGAVPSFTDSVDIIGAQNRASPSATTIQVLMPNFQGTMGPSSVYSEFNGICGQLTWAALSQVDPAAVQAAGQAAYASTLAAKSQELYSSILENIRYENDSETELSGLTGGGYSGQSEAQMAAQAQAQANEQAIPDAEKAQAAAELTAQANFLSSGDTGAITAGEAKTALSARATAIQQMYSDLLPVAQMIVNNDTQLAAQPPPSIPPKPLVPGAPPPPPLMVASQPFGLPLGPDGQPCNITSGSASTCTAWGASPTDAGSPLLAGTELQTAVLDYTGVMTPTLELMAQGSADTSVQASKKFIQGAEAKGWLMAGSYFFDLASLNAHNRNAGVSSTDVNSELDKSSFSLNTLTTSFKDGGSCEGPATLSTKYPVFCNVLNGNSSYAGFLVQLFSGSQTTGVVSPPTQKVTSSTPIKLAAVESSVFGYLQNALILQLPGQEGEKPLNFANTIQINFSSFSYSIPAYNFPCGYWGWPLGCVGRSLGNIFYNDFLLNMINVVVAFLIREVNDIIMKFVMIPVVAFASIFLGAVNILSLPGINPIIALANMGTYYINFVGALWQIMLADIVTYVVTFIGIILIPFFIIALPLVTSMASLMMGIGFVTAYYIPFVPYMIFTFGTIAWFMAVIEAMVAAPIMALGVIHPEGQHEVFGKSEQGVMILMNVFLRPAMMIIGYIAAISLTYVGIWILNAGFDEAAKFMGGKGQFSGGGNGPNYAGSSGFNAVYSMFHGGLNGNSAKTVTAPINTVAAGTISGGYTGWAGIFAYFFSILIYTSMYMTIVEKAFGLISNLPDKVLRWIGGSPEQYGEHAAQWGEQIRGKVEKGGEASEKGMQGVEKQMTGMLSSIKPPSAGDEKGTGGGGE
jgi:defect-in-organelle-trafficking protein DotA